jgi:putative hydrolase of the HAD superfamily
MSAFQSLSFDSSIFEPPQVIFLDAVGTLFGICGSVGEIYASFAATAGVSVEPKALNRAFFQSFAAAPKAAFPGVAPDLLPELEYCWWRAVAAKSFDQVGVYQQLQEQSGDFDTFFRPLFDHFVNPDPWVVYPEVRETLATWQAAGIRLGVLSNFDSRLHPLLKVLDLAPFFESVTISTQVGAAKPDSEVFQTALKQQNITANKRVWHIGDSWSEDVLGAEAAELQAVWLNRDGEIRPNGGQHVIEVTTLAELQITDV